MWCGCCESWSLNRDDILLDYIRVSLPELLSKVETFNGTNSGLSLLKNKTPASKSQIVKTWQWILERK